MYMSLCAGAAFMKDSVNRLEVKTEVTDYNRQQS